MSAATTASRRRRAPAGRREGRDEQAEDLAEGAPETVRRRRIAPAERQPEALHLRHALRRCVGLRRLRVDLRTLRLAVLHDLRRLRDNRSAERGVLPEPLGDREAVSVHRRRQGNRDDEQDQLHSTLVPAADAVHHLVERALERAAEAVGVRALLVERVLQDPADDRRRRGRTWRPLALVPQRLLRARDQVLAVRGAVRRRERVEQRERKDPRRDVRRLPLPAEQPAGRLHQRLDARIVEERVEVGLAVEQPAQPFLEVLRAKPEDRRDALVDRRADDAQQEVEKEEADENIERRVPADVGHRSKL